MYCKTKSIFTSCTADVTYLEGYDIRSPIYDYSDFEEEFLSHGNENVAQPNPNPKPRKSKKHKHKHKHKHRRHKRKCKEKRDREQDEKQEQQPAAVQAQNQQGICDAEQQRSITKRQPDIPAETNNDSHTRSPSCWNWRKSLPSSYTIGDAEINFNLERSKSTRTIQRPLYTTTPSVIPKLKRVRLNMKLPSVETAVRNATSSAVWGQEHDNEVPPSALPIYELDLLPKSEDLWKSYEASKLGAALPWPLCCIQNVPGAPSVESVPPVRPKRSFSPLPDNKGAPSDAVTWLLDYVENDCDPREREKSTQQMEDETDSLTTSNMDMDTLEISLDEERGLLDCLKSKRLHTPLNDIKAFDLLLGMVRSEENRKMLRDLLKVKLLGQRMSKEQPKCLYKEPVCEEGEEEGSKSEEVVNTNTKICPAEAKVEEPLSKQSGNPAESEALQQQPTAVTVPEPPKDEVQPQAEEKNEQLVIISVETLPTCNPLPVPHHEEAVQRWLQELGQHLSDVVQSRIEAMPVPSETPNATATPLVEPIDFEAEISQLPMATANATDKEQSTTASVVAGTALGSSSSWEGSYKQRLEKYDNVIDQNMSEFRDPLEKRLRSRLTNASNNNSEVITKGMESLKRILLMPPLPSHLDQGLQQIRILRPPTKRKIEQAKLSIDVKMVRTYSSIHINLKLDLHQLALEMDNAVYNSDIQVLQKRYEAAQIAWIWENGSVLISNVRNKTILTETQVSLLSQILKQTPRHPLNQHIVQQSQMITIAQFPWHICIEEFCQTYSLSTETIQGNFRYGYYVNKSIPSVAAKVYESGTIHVLAMSPAEADQMLEKLYLLTANHRKAKSSKILSQAKPSYKGTFISLFPNKTDKAKSS